jgi:putative peptide zinc metalloprotease protein
VTTSAATSRPLPLRKRPDLSFTPQWHRGRRQWLVKDPVSLSFFHLRDEEYEVLSRLDGRTSLNDLRDHFERRFAPNRITIEGLRAFVAMLHSNGLVLSESSGQGDQLLERHDRDRRKRLLAAVANPLAVQFRGIDPEPLLRRLAPMTKWMFSPLSLLVCLGLGLAAITLVTVQFDVLQARLPGFREFFAGRNLVWLFGTLAVTKVLHEFGHALACRHVGGECHEIGLMLLVFTPCLYCNVSDSWQLPNKWQRIAVAAAGMYVELFLASVCTFLWWFSHPGLLNTLCLNVMFVCSVSTVLFNGNPLLRYDGYYILSDWLEVPNLWQQSRAVVYDALARWCLGLESLFRGTAESNRPLLAVYALASMAYRTFVLTAILWFVYRWLAERQLEIAGQLFVAIVLGGLLAAPCIVMAKILRDPGRRRLIQRHRLALTGLAVAVVLVAVLAIPLPYSVKSPAAVRLEGSWPVHVAVDGTVLSTVSPGAVVRPGAPLATLANRDMELERKRLEGERNQQLKRIESLSSLRVVDPEAAALLPAAREKLKRLENELKQQLDDMRQLTLRAPTAGTVIPPQRRAATEATRTLSASGSLGMWTGTPFDEQNRGSLLKRGTLFCLIGDADRLEVVAMVDESGVELVGLGQKVTLVFEQDAGQAIEGTVTEIAPASSDATLNSLVFSEDRVLRRKAESGRRKASEPPNAQRSTGYTVRIRLEHPPAGLRLGSRGTAKIHTAPRSLGWRCLRFLRRTFSFDVPRGGKS